MKSNPKHKAYTLVEILIALGLMGLVLAATTSITLQLLRSYSNTGARLKINSDMRKLTRDMTTDAVYANYFVIYPSFTERSVTTTSGGVTTTVNNSVTVGKAGDMVVLVSVNAANAVTNLVGYYRDAADGTAGPVRSFRLDFTAAPVSSSALYTVLDTYMPTSRAHTNPQVVPLALGQSSGDLFYNFEGHAIMVRSKIEETGDLFTGLATHTYNFTVAPRG